jgi:hypothetical protein
MRPLSRRARFLLIVLAGAAAMLAGALPVLVSSGHPPTTGVTVQAGSVGTTGPESAVDPGDGTTPDTAPPPSSTSSVPPAVPSLPATTRPTTAAPAPGAPAACKAQNLEMTAGTDRVTYRPGDHIEVTATVTNQAAQPCWVTDQGTSAEAAACDPEVLLQLYDATDGYNALLGPSHAPCGPDPTVVLPGQSVSAQVDVPFTPPEACGPNPAAPACQLRSGSWTVVVSWLTGGSSSGDAGMSAELVFFCPPDACSPAPSSPPGPSTTATTGPSTSTSATTTQATTSTTAPATHKSSTTTTTVKTTSTTTRKASRRSGG